MFSLLYLEVSSGVGVFRGYWCCGVVLLAYLGVWRGICFVAVLVWGLTEVRVGLLIGCWIVFGRFGSGVFGVLQALGVCGLGFV